MNDEMSKFETGAYGAERLESIRLTAVELAEARTQWARAEAIAEVIFRVWTATDRLLRRAATGAVGGLRRYADSLASSAIKASERERDDYLARSIDTADLERRIRSWQARHYAFPN